MGCACIATRTNESKRKKKTLRERFVLSLKAWLRGRTPDCNTDVVATPSRKLSRKEQQEDYCSAQYLESL